MAQAELHSDSAPSNDVARREAAESVGTSRLGDVEETIIGPETGLPTLGLRDLWKYRDLIYYLTLRNVKVRYKQTVLGVLWAVLQPVLLMAGFAIALRQASGMEN